MVTVAAKWLRRLEISLAIAGILFLGGAFAATVARWDYQERQERALLLVNVPRGNLHSQAAVDAPRGEPNIDPLVLGRIEIPRIGVRAIVREGIDDATLDLAVGHVRGTARPGEKGNTVLAGHRDTFFRALRNIRVCDRILLVVPPQSYEYRVVSFDILAPGETKALDPTKNDLLTLVTCYPFQYIGHAPKRFIVRAARIE